MMKKGKPEKGSTVARAVKAVRFVQTHRYFTIGDLAIELGMHKNNAKQYFEAMSLHMPIVEIKPPRYREGCPGRMAAIFSLIPD